MHQEKLRDIAFRAILTALILAAICVNAKSGTQSHITSWNAYSKQFIDAPVFRLLPLPGTTEYRALVQQGDKKWMVHSKTPSLNLANIWRRLETKKFSLTLAWVGPDGKMIESETSERVKAPDFEGFKEPAVDWAAAADRNIAYLIDAAEQAPAPSREPGVPVWIWSASPGYDLSYPCITINHLAWAFLAHIENNGPQSAEALRLARIGADWALEHRQPNSGALPLFPFSTVTMGKYGGSIEGASVNLLRASWLAISYVDLYQATRHEPTWLMAAISPIPPLSFKTRTAVFPIA